MSLLMSSEILDRMFGKVEERKRFAIKKNMIGTDWFFVDFEPGKPHQVSWSEYEFEAMIFFKADEGREFADIFLYPRQIRVEQL